MRSLINKKSVSIGAALLIALVLKLLYPLADTNDVRMFVRPTAEIVSVATNESFTHDARGFYFPELNVLIDKSCSGFNFFVIALCVFVSIVPYHHLSRRQCVALFPVLIVFTYSMTICVNTSRIVVALFILKLEPLMPWITQPWVHEAEGALVYLFSLLGAYLIITHYLHKFTLHNAKRSQSLVAADH